MKACYSGKMNTIVRIVAWLLAAAVTFATLGPAELRPHSDFGQDGEHLFAFILIGLAFATAYPRHRPIAAVTCVVMTGVLELLQLVAPGRHARLEDFVVDAVAALAGFAIASVIGWSIRSHWHAKT
jgi:VanZ family protein